MAMPINLSSALSKFTPGILGELTSRKKKAGQVSEEDFKRV